MGEEKWEEGVGNVYGYMGMGRRESKRNRWDEEIRDGENGMGRYGKVEGE
jgi:hypothetical protein